MYKTFLTKVITCVVTFVALETRAKTEQVGKYTWTYWINDDSVEIRGNWNDSAGTYDPAINPLPNGAVTIPSTLGDAPVTHLGYKAFSGCSGLTSVTIPSGVTDIGTAVFADCNGLRNVKIPSSVTSIGVSAFEHCNGLISVVIPNSVTNINSYAFTDCSSLTNVTLPSRLTCINNGLFYACSDLIGPLTIPDGVTSIGNYAFTDCISLKGVTIPNGVRNIGNYTFHGCKSLTSVTIPNSVTNIGREAFLYCNSLTNVYVSTDYTGTLNMFSLFATIIRYKPRQIVSFDVADGNVSPTELIVDYATDYGLLPVPSRIGYTFIEWKLNGKVINVDSIVTTLDDHILTAQWKANQYNVMFDANGGVGGTSGKQDYGSSIVAPEVTREGHTFAGWQPALPETVPANDVTYTAQWNVNQYTMTFEGNGGALGERALPRVTVKQDYGTTLVAPTATREWCTFVGWMPAPPVTVPANNVTYTAQWRRWGDSISASAMGGKPMKQLYPADYANMTDVVIEEGILELPKGFFDGCDNVVRLTLPESLREFGIDDLPPKIRATLAYDANGFMIYPKFAT